MKTVTIIQRVLPHYRVSLFDKLYESLAANGINLKIIYGQERPGTVPKTVEYDRAWSIKIKNRYINIGSTSLVWQPCHKYLHNSKIIIIEQANSLIIDYLLLFRLIERNAKIAYWGHGKNFQATNKNIFSEKIKSTLSRKVDWWFAYNDKSAEIVMSSGFKLDKITVVNNTIDTIELAAAAKAVTHEKINLIKNELCINSDNVSVYCGGLYPNKKLDFLVDSCLFIKKSIPDFHMVFIGEGPQQQRITDICAVYPWMHYVGPKYGIDRIAYLKLAKNILMPGLVGLIMIDSFVLGLPIYTTNVPFHSPEIQYLENGINGIITEHKVKEYADTVISYFDKPEKQAKLVKGCNSCASRYGLDNMVNNFTDGIRKVLAS